MGKKINMKVVILAGGFGTRLSEYTKTIPKPMINIAGKPMLLHIMKFYAKYGFKDFYIALGYKGEIIKKFFKKNYFNWNINLEMFGNFISPTSADYNNIICFVMICF